MNSRKPTKAELIFLEAAATACGCVACNKLGYENDYLPEQLAIHHNPDKGNKAPLIHFFGIPICGVHHQGAVPSGMKLPKGEPVRHSPLGSHSKAFKEQIGTDLDLSRYVWDRISLDAKDKIGEITGIYDYSDLLKLDARQRNGS
jgi:hypothetical protein